MSVVVASNILSLMLGNDDDGVDLVELPFGDDIEGGGDDEKRADVDFEDEAAYGNDAGGEKELPDEAMAARASS